jgi:DNA polymerase elongation subunit (family B)
MLADRIAERDGTIVASNERIPFVFVIPKVKALKGKTILQGDRIEDPKYIIQNKIDIDYLHYITNQIMKPSMQFLELISTNAQKIFDDFIAKETTRRKGMNLITEYLFDNDEINNYENNENNGFIITF